MRLPRRGGGGSGMRGSGGGPRSLTPVLRLLALLAIVVAALVFFGLLIQSCASTSKHDSYKSYMDKVATIAHSSEDDGTAVANALITPGVKADDAREHAERHRRAGAPERRGGAGPRRRPARCATRTST